MGELNTYIVVSGKGHLPNAKGGEDVIKGGEQVESDMNLDVMFPHKYVRADQTDSLPKAAARKVLRQLAAPKKAKPKVGESGFDPATVDEERQKLRQEKTQEVVADDHDGEDVTTQFATAQDNDLKVYHVKKLGYTAFDGKKKVNAKPLTTKTKMEDALSEYVG